MTFQEIKYSFWRVPLISLIAGFLYAPCYVQIVLHFGVIEPGVIDDKVSLLTSGFLMIAVLILGWMILLRKQTRMAVLISSSIVVIYGLLLLAIQSFSGSTTGPIAVIFMYLNTPLEWTVFPSTLHLYLQEHLAIEIPLMGFLRFFVPWIFILFTKKSSIKDTDN